MLYAVSTNLDLLLLCELVLLEPLLVLLVLILLVLKTQPNSASRYMVANIIYIIAYKLLFVSIQETKYGKIAAAYL